MDAPGSSVQVQHRVRCNRNTSGGAHGFCKRHTTTRTWVEDLAYEAGGFFREDNRKPAGWLEFDPASSCFCRALDYRRRSS